MALNLELKARVENHEVVKQVLKNIGSKFEKMLNQRDIYYKIENGLLKLRIENGNYSLIKYNREERKSDRWSNYYVVNMEGSETELLFSSLFPIETEVMKQRELYMYKDTRIHLDTVENLGKFIELETVVHGEKGYAKVLFDEMIELLKLDLNGQIRSSYRDLILAK